MNKKDRRHRFHIKWAVVIVVLAVAGMITFLCVNRAAQEPMLITETRADTESTINTEGAILP